MSATHRWDGDAWLKRFQGAIGKGLDAMAITLETRMVENVSRRGATQRHVSGTVQHVSKSGRVTNTFLPGLEHRKGLATTVNTPFGHRQIIPGRPYWTGAGSPPGTPPFMRSGRFRQTIGFGRGESPMVRYAGSGVGAVGEVPYAKRLEFGYFGTDSKGRTYHQPARPWARPSARQARGEMLRVFVQTVSQEAKAATVAAVGGLP